MALRSLRVLARHWKLTAIAVFSLSIAMALGVIALSIANTFLLVPPAAPEPDRLVMIYSHSPTQAVDQISYLDYKYFEENNHVFTDIAAAPNSIGINEDNNFENHVVKVITRPVSGNYFSVLGIRPHLGRLLTPDDETSKTKVGMMTYSCWTRLGSDPKIIGKTLTHTVIVGVLPKEYTGALYGVNGDLLIPLSDTNYDASSRANRDARRLVLTARLKPGVTRAQAQAEIAALAGQLSSAYPNDDKDRTAVVTRATLLPPEAIPTAELIGAILMGVVLLVLLIACANVANLLLAVAVGRRQEAVIKLALGAPRGRLIREFLRESAILCVSSGILGFLIAAFVAARYSKLDVALPMIGSVSFSFDLHLDATVAAFTLGLMFIAMLATGIAPALYASSPSLAQVLSGELVIGGTGKALRRNILVIVEVAVCTLVLVGMGLCQRSLYNLRHVDPGFSARNLISVDVYPQDLSQAQTKALFAKERDQVAALPGVESVTLASGAPLLGDYVQPVKFPGAAKPKRVGTVVVDPDYFSTIRLPLLSGRVFNSFDSEKTPEVAVINHKMAEMWWPGADPIGRTFELGEHPRKITVVGVVKDGKYDDLDEAPRPFIYLALSQNYQSAPDIIARTAGNPELWVVPLAKTLQSANVIVLNPITYDGLMNLTLLGERLTAGAVASLSALALVLAVIGLFGAISYSVSERRKELGIRVALGAQPWQLLKMVLRQTLFVAGAGIFIGLSLGIGATLLLRSQFYQIGTVEWTVLVPVSAAMLAVSLGVAYLSARPWLHVDAMEAVRHA